MKKYLLLGLILFSTATVKSQNAFQDARHIIRLQRRLIPSVCKDTIAKVADTIGALLNKYVNNRNTSLSFEQLKQAYDFSTYLSRLIETKGAAEKPTTLADIREYLKDKNGQLNITDQAVADSIRKNFQRIDSLSSSKALQKFIDMSPIAVTDTAFANPLTDGQKEIIQQAFAVVEPLPSRAAFFRKYTYLQNVITNRSAFLVNYSEAILKSFKESPTIFQPILHQIGLTTQKVSTDLFDITVKLQDEQQAQKQAVQQRTAAAMALPSESEVVDAIAIYLVGRVKSEAALAFLDLVRNRLKGDTILLNLFPKTRDLLARYPTYEAPNFGQSWRHAVAADLATVPDKLSADPAIQRYLQSHLAVNDHFYRFFCLAVKLCSMSRDNANFIDIVDYLYKDLNSKDDFMLSGYIQLWHMVNNEFYTSGTNGYWISYGDFTKLSPEEFQVLLGLLRQRYPVVFNFIQVRFKSGESKKLPSIDDVHNWMSRLFFIINQYQIALQHKDASFKDKPHDIGSYWTFIGDSFRQFTSLENNKFILKIDTTLDIAADTAKYQQYVNLLNSTYQQLSGLYGAIEDKNYPHVLEASVELMRKLESPESRYRKMFCRYFLSAGVNSPERFTEWCKNGQNKFFYEAMIRYQSDVDAEKNAVVVRADVEDLVQCAGAVKDEFMKSEWFQSAFLKGREKFIRNFCDNDAWYLGDYDKYRYAAFTKVATFLNDVMVTNDSGDLSKVISSYASPPQSYRLKRTTRYSFDLNAYVGIVGGVEGFKYPQFSYGLTAPIGLAFSWSGTNKIGELRTIKKNGDMVYLRGNSNSVSLSIIDIGAVVRYRFGSGAAQGLPQSVNFSQFISPALQYHIGIRDTPIDVVFGYQYLPRLRSFDNAATGSGLNAVSFVSLGLVFDLPLMNLYHYN